MLQQKITCSGSSIVWALHGTTDMRVFIDPDMATTGSTTNVVTPGCSKTYTFDECGEYLSLGSLRVHLKFTGSCPASADAPCFSREAEAKG